MEQGMSAEMYFGIYRYFKDNYSYFVNIMQDGKHKIIALANQNWGKWNLIF